MPTPALKTVYSWLVEFWKGSNSALFAEAASYKNKVFKRDESKMTAFAALKRLEGFEVRITRYKQEE